MFFVDLSIATFVPMIVPIASFWLSKIKIDSRIQKIEQNNYKKVSSLSKIYKELPAAFIGNAIWGFTYHLEYHIDILKEWIIFYFFVTIVSILFLIYSYTRIEEINLYKKISKGFAAVLFICSVIRIIVS